LHLHLSHYVLIVTLKVLGLVVVSIAAGFAVLLLCALLTGNFRCKGCKRNCLTGSSRSGFWFCSTRCEFRYYFQNDFRWAGCPARAYQYAKEMTE
jgi:hypothetical protein